MASGFRAGRAAGQGARATMEDFVAAGPLAGGAGELFAVSAPPPPPRARAARPPSLPPRGVPPNSRFLLAAHWDFGAR